MIKNGVQVISTEMIKPAAAPPPQTSHRLKNLKLSYLDRLLPPVYVPLIFFYKPHQSSTSNHLQISQKLKHSLLQTLPSFYPLAGRLKYNHAVDCNDAGVEFIDARAHARLHHVLQQPDSDLNPYIPPDCTTFDHGQRPLLLVQTTFFDCGGLALAVCISHKIGDFASAMAFLNAWAATCRAQPAEDIPHLSFGTTNYFPLFSFFPYDMFIKLFQSNDEFLTKRFVFENKTLQTLKQVATSSPDSTVKDPSRVELVSAFIWKHFMAARLKNVNIFAAIMAVSLRARTTPPGILENVFGNCFMSPFEFDDGSGKFHHLISKLRRTIRKVEGDYITKPLNKESYIKDLAKMSILLLSGKLEWCYFTSWRGFPVYEVDFGWGTPLWFSTTSMPIKNLVVLVSSKSGDDIEAIVTMKQQDLQIIEAQINLISTQM